MQTQRVVNPPAIHGKLRNGHYIRLCSEVREDSYAVVYRNPLGWKNWFAGIADKSGRIVAKSVFQTEREARLLYAFMVGLVEYQSAKQS